MLAVTISGKLDGDLTYEVALASLNHVVQQPSNDRADVILPLGNGARGEDLAQQQPVFVVLGRVHHAEQKLVEVLRQDPFLFQKDASARRGERLPVVDYRQVVFKPGDRPKSVVAVRGAVPQHR